MFGIFTQPAVIKQLHLAVYCPHCGAIMLKNDVFTLREGDPDPYPLNRDGSTILDDVSPCFMCDTTGSN